MTANRSHSFRKLPLTSCTLVLASVVPCRDSPAITHQYPQRDHRDYKWAGNNSFCGRLLSVVRWFWKSDSLISSPSSHQSQDPCTTRTAFGDTRPGVDLFDRLLELRNVKWWSRSESVKLVISLSDRSACRPSDEERWKWMARSSVSVVHSIGLDG
jgi:hypothetical protein